MSSSNDVLFADSVRPRNGTKPEIDLADATHRFGALLFRKSGGMPCGKRLHMSGNEI
jgi:hypothetical protein